MGAFFVSIPLESGSQVDREKLLAELAPALALRSPGNATCSTLGDSSAITSGSDCRSYSAHGCLVVVDGALSAYGEHDAEIVAKLLESGSFNPEQFDGHFAALVMNNDPFSVSIFRDRYGTRPVYWARLGGNLLIASEVEMLRTAGVELSINMEALATSMRFRWVLDDHHLMKPVRQVPVGHVTTINSTGSVSSKRYWSLSFTPKPLAQMDMAAAATLAQEALRTSLSRLARNANGVTILLSGGVDSSIIAAAAQDANIKTLAIIGDLPDSDGVETERAIQVAKHLNLDYKVVRIAVPGTDDFSRMIDRIEEIPRNPNNVVLAQLYAAASEHGDTVLNGDAAEMFWGLADSLKVENYRAKRRLLDQFGVNAGWPGVRALERSGNSRLRRLGRLCRMDVETYASSLDAVLFSPDIDLLLNQQFPFTQQIESYENAGHFDDVLHSFQASTFLVTSLLRHDRMAQPFGLRPVTPFLLPEMVHEAQVLPRELRHAGSSRAVLREVCDRWLPREVSRWSKRGFEVSWQLWMKEAFLQIKTPHQADAVLPVGFRAQALAANDQEALWNVFSLRRLADHFQLY